MREGSEMGDFWRTQMSDKTTRLIADMRRWQREWRLEDTHVIPEAIETIERLREQLVKARDALQDAALQIHYMHTKFQTTGTGETALARIQAALIDEIREAAGKRPVPSVSRNTDGEQQHDTTGVTAGETAALPSAQRSEP